MSQDQCIQDALRIAEAHYIAQGSDQALRTKAVRLRLAQPAPIQIVIEVWPDNDNDQSACQDVLINRVVKHAHRCFDGIKHRITQ